MTLFVQPQDGNRYIMAIVLDRGPDNYEWIKVQLPNGEEAFCYSDTDLTFDIKSIEPGNQVAISTPRPCNKPGTTKWTCNALHINLQLFDAAPQKQLKSFDSNLTSSIALEEQKRAKPTASVPYTLARYQFIQKVMQDKGFEGKYARGEAVGYIVDTCMSSGLV
jgi:hypothetical protein